MIYSIECINYLGESITFELAKPEKSGFALLGATGLGPGSSDLSITELATMDGGYFNSARIPTRVITLNFRYLWNITIEDSRQRLYKYFPLKKSVRIKVKTDNRYLMIDGVVESNDPDIFSQYEGSTVTIKCPYPYFVDAEGAGNEYVFYGTQGAFECPFPYDEELIGWFENEKDIIVSEEDALRFPFPENGDGENILMGNIEVEHVTTSFDGIEFGLIKNNSDETIKYDGDEEIGVVMTASFLGNITNFIVQNSSTGDVMFIDGTFLNGQKLVIDTRKGSKSVTRYSTTGIASNALSLLDLEHSNWLTLVNGDNTFSFRIGSGDIKNVKFSLEYHPIYQGI